MACGALFRCRHQVAHRAVDSLVCHTAVGANLPSTLVQSSQRTVCQLGVVLHRYRLDCIYIYNACHLFPFLYVKLHRVLRNATGHGRGVVATQYAPLTTVFNPSVTAWHLPYILHSKTQGRRIIVFCISVFGVVQMSRGEIRWKFGQPKKVRRRWKQFYEGRAVSLLYKSFDTALWGLAVTICDFSERSFRSCFKFIEK